MAVIEVSVSSFVIVQQGSGSSDKVGNVVSTIHPSHTVDAGLNYQSLSNTVRVGHFVTLSYGIKNIGVSHSLTLTQSTHPRTHIESVSSNVGVNGFLQITKHYAPTSIVSIAQVVDANVARGTFNTLEITGLAEVSVVRALNLVSSVNIVNEVNVYKPTGLWVNPATSLPTYTASNRTVSFSYGGITLTLPKPDMGDGDKFDFTRINRRSRGNTLIIYRDPVWPKTRTLSLTFSWLNESQVYSILDFLELTLGKEIQYVDHREVTWNGFIMTPAAQLTQTSRPDLAITLDFQGVKA